MPENCEIEHTADRAFAIHGNNLRELFQAAARALLATQDVLIPGVNVTREIQSAGVDRETLLVNWLNEILYLQEVHDETYKRCELTDLSETEMRGRLFGVTGTARRPVKAVTFHQLRMENTADGLQTTIVVDV